MTSAVINNKPQKAGESESYYKKRLTSQRESVGDMPHPRVVQQVEPVRAKIFSPSFRGLKWVSVFVLLLAVGHLFLAPIPWPDTINLAWHYDQLWLDNLYKQISGYTLLSLALLSAVFFIRRRIKGFVFGRYATWRSVHSVLGMLCIATLIVHTGLRLGSGLNFALSMSVLALAFLGGVTALITALNVSSSIRSIKSLKLSLRRFHLYLLFPLFLFLTFHVVAVYYF